jgi:hypothetical protein
MRDEPLRKIDIQNPGVDQLPHPAAQVVEAEEDRVYPFLWQRKRGPLFP